MACVSPPELTDAQLLSYVDGEVNKTIANHLERCEHCRVRAEELARMRDRLAARLFRITCPTSISLGEYHLGLLEDEPAVAIRQHLEECPHCSREVAQLERYLADLAPTIERSSVQRVQVFIARLVNGGRRDNGEARPPTLAPAFAALRGEGSAPRIYTVDGGQVSIEIQDDVEQPDRKTILGLVTGIEARNFTASLWQAEQRITTTSVDEFGNFIIPHLTPGQYEMILGGPEVEIHIQSLQV